MKRNVIQAMLNAAAADRAYHTFIAALNVRLAIGPIRRKAFCQAVYQMALKG